MIRNLIKLLYYSGINSYFTTPFYFSQLYLTKWNWEIISFPHRCQYPNTYTLHPFASDVEKFWLRMCLSYSKAFYLEKLQKKKLFLCVLFEKITKKKSFLRLRFHQRSFFKNLIHTSFLNRIHSFLWAHSQ